MTIQGHRTRRSGQLFDPGPAIEGLTDRQRKAFEAIQAAGSATPHEIGLLLGASSMFATSTGRGVCLALKKRGLVVERRSPARFELARALRPEPPTDWKGF